MNLDQAFEFATDTAREAGALLRDYYQRGVTAEYKGEIDLVTEADRASERLILDRIRAAYPDHAILSEENGANHQTSRYRWIADPLDGTTNFAHGFPAFCVTLALLVDDTLELGVTYDPLRDELFAARRGRGARLNDRVIHVSKTPLLDRALLCTGFPYDRRTNPLNNTQQFEAFLRQSQAVLRVGSAALDLAYVACGRLDGFWEFRLNAWDMAAGVLLVNEAGGHTSEPDGSPVRQWSGRVVASNSLFHAEMIDVLAQSETTWPVAR
ncbi:MAG: inositol monophosphatase [Chloroflexi bacterium]|nr:inositol monophosphatase [Chloroflexota bacterium]